MSPATISIKLAVHACYGLHRRDHVSREYREHRGWPNKWGYLLEFYRRQMSPTKDTTSMPEINSESKTNGKVRKIAYIIYMVEPLGNESLFVGVLRDRY